MPIQKDPQHDAEVKRLLAPSPAPVQAPAPIPVAPPAPAPEVRRAEPVGPAAPKLQVDMSVLNQWNDAPTGGATTAPPVAAPVAGPVAAPVAPPVAVPVGPEEEKEPPRLDRSLVTRSLGKGSKGDQVEALQHFLGIEGDAADGIYGSGTAGKVAEWQKANGLPATGRVDPQTVAAMRGDKYIYGYSMNHDPEKFVPKYAMTAYHESNDMRNSADPYATGAITHPDRKTDPGGKTYGTYQFESYTYPGGDSAGEKKVAGSTVARFANWEGNPYAKQFQEVIAKHGIGSAEFDALWTKLSTTQNQGFGGAQERFLEHDKEDEVHAMFDKLGASPEARKDPRLFDLLMGTTNQIGNLANGVAADVAAQQKKNGKPFNADELGRAVIDDKIANVNRFFASSKQATKDGVRARFNDERTVFEKKPDQPHTAES